MNYENLYSDLQADEKKLKDSTNLAQRLYKAIVKDTETGDLKDMRKQIEGFRDALRQQEEAVEALRTIAEAFDEKAYFESGDFARQMLAACGSQGVDVRGEYPVYEMFPYRVRIDTEALDLYMNRKKVATMRPTAFVNMVKSSQEKLRKAAFNAQSFAQELAQGYDLAVLKMKKKPDADILLSNIYKMMVPMSRSRKEYDQQSFAYDIARLYEEFLQGNDTVKDGRRFAFGTSRNNNAIRILDHEGKEQFLATIRFF